MGLTNTATAYGFGTKTLHWATVALLLAQFLVGYLALDDDSSGHGRGRGRGRGGDSGHGRGRGGDDVDEQWIRVHVALGIAILTIAVVRVVWRRATSLPAWDERLSETDRQVERWTEVVLLLLLFVIPLTGLALVLPEGVDDPEDDLLGLHVAAHVTFFVLLAAHVSIALRRRTLGRML